MYLFVYFFEEIANELAQLPAAKRRESTRRQPKKVPSYHLTSPKSMQFIREADERAKAKEEKEKQQRALQQNTSLNSSYTIPAGQAKLDTSTTKKLHNLDS